MRKFGMILAGAAVLAGCGQSKILGKSLPDETKVIDGPTLALPPSFELRPPREAKDYESVLQEQAQAKVQTLVTGVSGSTVAPARGAAPKDGWLIQQAGAGQSDIRKQLEDDGKAPEVKKSKGLFDKWFGRDNDE